MSKALERLERLFEKSEEWEYENPCTPGNENPYPEKIYYAFLKYYSKHYKAVVTYETAEDGVVTFDVDEDTLYDATGHAWFDGCFDGCVRTLESFISDYYAECISQHDDGLLGDVKVETFTKKGEKYWKED